eukprot:COSAG01_NODE_73578_length_242_cov_1.524476_1_plen_24_part_10
MKIQLGVVYIKQTLKLLKKQKLMF